MTTKDVAKELEAGLQLIDGIARDAALARSLSLKLSRLRDEVLAAGRDPASLEEVRHRIEGAIEDTCDWGYVTRDRGLLEAGLTALFKANIALAKLTEEVKHE